jgi:hypothetical protein
MENLNDNLANSTKRVTGTDPTSDTPPEFFRQLATYAGRLLLFSSIIVNTRKEPSFLIGASIISLYAGTLLVKSALIESEVQQVAPGETTLANKLKLIGTTGNLVFSTVLFFVLLIETYLGTPPTIAGQTPATGTVGALFI